MDNEMLLQRIEALEKEVKSQSFYKDIVEVQMLQARYVFYLENGLVAQIWDDLFIHGHPETRLEIMDSGAYLGSEHVQRALYTMGGRVDQDGNPVKKTSAMSNTNTDRAALLLMLTISTPYVTISGDGTRAWGQWHIFGPHTNRVFDPDSCTKKDTAFWIAGKYDNEYIKVDGQWKFLKLRPICWLRTPYDKSWLERADCRRTPTPYWPPDEPARISSFNPDEGPNPDKWGPMIHEWIQH